MLAGQAACTRATAQAAGRAAEASPGSRVPARVGACREGFPGAASRMQRQFAPPELLRRRSRPSTAQLLEHAHAPGEVKQRTRPQPSSRCRENPGNARSPLRPPLLS